MTYHLAGRTVVITGAAGGLGKALAEELRRKKANLALVDVDSDTVDAAAEKLGGDRVARGWKADVRSLEDLTRTMASVEEHFGRVDVVIAGAGIANNFVPMADLDADAWARTVDINLNGVWRTFKAALPHVTKHQGSLVAVSSMSSFIHSPLHGAYPATKAGVWAMCDSLRLELRHTGVAVTSVHPTFFKTPMMDAAEAEPASNRVWNNHQGMWKYVPVDTVIADIVRGIEQRTSQVVSPRNLGFIALAPGLAQKIAARFGFRGNTIPDAIALAQASQPTRG
jgi:NAD(P)-dependent dehydrogenase (short-subunit alcohol dehydrogenase family)